MLCVLCMCCVCKSMCTLLHNGINIITSLVQMLWYAAMQLIVFISSPLLTYLLPGPGMIQTRVTLQSFTGWSATV